MTSEIKKSEKPLRILAAETHFPDQKQTNAADWWRTIRPFQELQKRTVWSIEIRKGIISEELGKNPHSPEALAEWQRIGESFDLVYFSYNHSAMFYSFVAVVTRKFGHTAMMDYDDNVIQQDLLNPTVVMSKLRDPYEQVRIDTILKDVDSLTVTNEYLNNEYRTYLKQFDVKKRISVVPNYIDLEVYKYKEHEKNDKELTIGFFGSTSHQADLYDRHFIKALSRIRKKYKNVRFEVLGNFIPKYLNGVAPSKIMEGTPDFYSWVELWQDIVCKWDIGVAPNRNTPFNKSRSNVKWQEFSAAKIPTVVSDIGLYNGTTALVAKSTQDWVDHLSRLIEDKQYRMEEGNKAYQEVKANWTIQGNWEKWANVITDRVKNPS